MGDRGIEGFASFRGSRARLQGIAGVGYASARGARLVWYMGNIGEIKFFLGAGICSMARQDRRILRRSGSGSPVRSGDEFAQNSPKMRQNSGNFREKNFLRSFIRQLRTGSPVARSRNWNPQFAAFAWVPDRNWRTLRANR